MLAPLSTTVIMGCITVLALPQIPSVRSQPSAALKSQDVVFLRNNCTLHLQISHGMLTIRSSTYKLNFSSIYFPVPEIRTLVSQKSSNSTSSRNAIKKNVTDTFLI